jgi:hypothetical protein
VWRVLQGEGAGGWRCGVRRWGCAADEEEE